MTPSCSRCHGWHSGALGSHQGSKLKVAFPSQRGLCHAEKAVWGRWAVEEGRHHTASVGGGLTSTSWGHFGLRGRLQTSGSPGGGAELSVSKAVFSSWGECRVSTWVSLQNYCTSIHLSASESLSPPIGPLPTPRPSPLLCSYHFVPGWFRH